MEVEVAMVASFAPEDLEVMDLMDHLVVVQVVEWEHLLDLVAQHHLFQHLKVVMVVMVVVVQATACTGYGSGGGGGAGAAGSNGTGAMGQEMVEMEFRYQTFQLLSEKMDTLLVVEQVVERKGGGNKTGGAGGAGGGGFPYLSEMLHLVQVAVVLAHLDLILVDLRVDPVVAVVVE